MFSESVVTHWRGSLLPNREVSAAGILGIASSSKDLVLKRDGQLNVGHRDYWCQKGWRWQHLCSVNTESLLLEMPGDTVYCSRPHYYSLLLCRLSSMIKISVVCWRRLLQSTQASQRWNRRCWLELCVLATLHSTETNAYIVMQHSVYKKSLRSVNSAIH